MWERRGGGEGDDGTIVTIIQDNPGRGLCRRRRDRRLHHPPPADQEEEQDQE
jgi:hypothetical protein